MNPRTKQGREELRVLCENATAGPWAVHDCGGRYESDNLHACGIVTESKSLRPWSSVPVPTYVIVSDSRDECSHPITDADAIFIARARTALPEALDALEAAEAVIEAARVWSECIEQGFASEMRPDIARAMFNRALREYDAKKAGR